jgi:F-type H+-transporting ATPase subunit c
MESLAFGLTYAIGAAFCGLGLGLVGMGAMQSIGRNPEAQPKIQGSMILAMALIDALAIIGLVVALIIKFVK